MNIDEVTRDKFEKSIADNCGAASPCTKLSGGEYSNWAVANQWIGYQQATKDNADLLEDANKWASDYLQQVEQLKAENDRLRKVLNSIRDKALSKFSGRNEVWDVANNALKSGSDNA